MMNENDANALAEMATTIVSAYVANNSIPMAELPTLIHSIHQTLGRSVGYDCRARDEDRGIEACRRREEIRN